MSDECEADGVTRCGLRDEFHEFQLMIQVDIEQERIILYRVLNVCGAITLLLLVREVALLVL